MIPHSYISPMENVNCSTFKAFLLFMQEAETTGIFVLKMAVGGHMKRAVLESSFLVWAKRKQRADWITLVSWLLSMS